MYGWGSSSAVAAGRWDRGHMHPGASREGAPKDGRGIFLRHDIYKNCVSSVEAEMGTEGQIICIEQSTF